MAKKDVNKYAYALILSILLIFTVYTNSTDQVILFFIFLILFILFKLDSRLFIIMGIITLVFSSLLFYIPLGNVAYFYLLFGVIGIIIQDFLSSRASTNMNDKARKKKASKKRRR